MLLSAVAHLAMNSQVHPQRLVMMGFVSLASRLSFHEHGFGLGQSYLRKVYGFAVVLEMPYQLTASSVLEVRVARWR